MGKVLITGMSGTGKSSLLTELKQAGHTTIDMDDQGRSIRDLSGNQLWNEKKLSPILLGHQTGHLFVAGCAENKASFYPFFNHIILLSAPIQVIKQRLLSRTNNPYGKLPDEMAEVLGHLNWVEPLLRKMATHEIVTTIPIAEVVAKVLSIANR